MDTNQTPTDPVGHIHDDRANAPSGSRDTVAKPTRQKAVTLAVDFALAVLASLVAAFLAWVFRG